MSENEEDPGLKKSSKSGSKTGSKTKSKADEGANDVDTGTNDQETSQQPLEKTKSKQGSTADEAEADAAPVSPTEMETAASDRTPKSSADLKKSKSKSSTGSKGEEKKKTSKQPKKRSKQTKSKGAADVSSCKIGFVGAGRMADSIARGLLKSEKVTAKQLFVAARSNKSFDPFKALGITTSLRPYEIFAKLDCDVVFLCMHGFVIRNCFKMGGTRPFPFTTNYIPWKRKQVVILSLVGGIPIKDIQVTLLNPEQSQKYQVVFHRMMINVSCAYGLGYGLLDVELDSKKCPTIVRDLLQLLGRIEYLDAAHMDAACALAGNGIAFCYYFITAMANGGFKMGLPRDRAFKMACKTLQSAALSLLESNMSAMELRDEICGPSGSAIFGLNIMDKKDFSGGVAHSVEAAYKRILELTEVEPAK